MTRTACLNSIYEMAKLDERVVFIGSDLSPNTLQDLKRDFPDRFFMEGVQEQNIIGMAAGLALEGFIPYVNTIATFLTRRCYEQIAIDLCVHNLPVRLIGNGGGLVYAPLGATHTAVDDIALMRALPNMAVVCCADNEEMKAMMAMSISYPGPMYFRLGKDTDPLFQPKPHDSNAKILIVSTGVMSAKLQNIEGCNILHMPIIKPFQYKTLLKALGEYNLIVTAEEVLINGGLGSAVIECLADNDIQIPVLRFGLPDSFPCHYGEQEDLLETYGLAPEKMASRIKEFYDAL